MNYPAKKVNKGQAKCYSCKKLTSIKNKEGGWINWEKMQVWLCISCEKDTRKVPERAAHAG